jgi:hypothetical protein
VKNPDPIAAYLQALRAELRRGRGRRRLVAEVEAHLLEAVRVRVEDGMESDDAVSEAVEAVGSPAEIAEELDRGVPAWRPSLRVLMAGGALVVVALLVVGILVVPQGGRSPEAIHAKAVRDAAAAFDVGQVSAALGLSADAAEVLAEAHAEAADATACLIENGAVEVAGGGIEDPGGTATVACQSVLDANEANLSSAAYTMMVEEAEPLRDSAVECELRLGDRPDGLTTEVPGVGSPVCWAEDGQPNVSA